MTYKSVNGAAEQGSIQQNGFVFLPLPPVTLRGGGRRGQQVKASPYPAAAAEAAVGAAAGRGGNGTMTTVMLSRPPESSANFAR